MLWGGGPWKMEEGERKGAEYGKAVSTSERAKEEGGAVGVFNSHAYHQRRYEDSYSYYWITARSVHYFVHTPSTTHVSHISTAAWIVYTAID